MHSKNGGTQAEEARSSGKASRHEKKNARMLLQHFRCQVEGRAHLAAKQRAAGQQSRAAEIANLELIVGGEKNVERLDLCPE